MKRSEIIEILKAEQWTVSDAVRAIEQIDFSLDPDELSLRRQISQFAGNELIKRQRLQAAQKGVVTKKGHEIERQKVQFTAEIAELGDRNKELDKQVKNLYKNHENLREVNELLKQDNKYLKNLIDAIRLKLTQDIRDILKLQDIEMRQAVAKLFKSSRG
jgi:FtsZ-binding cell division protein ZapB